MQKALLNAAKRGERLLRGGFHCCQVALSWEEWGHLLNEPRNPGAPFLPVRRVATGTTFALRFVLWQK